MGEGAGRSEFIDFRHIVKTLIEGGEGHVWSEGWVWDELHNEASQLQICQDISQQSAFVSTWHMFVFSTNFDISPFQVYKNIYSQRRYHWEPLHRRDVKYVAGSRPWARQQAIYQLIASGIC